MVENKITEIIGDCPSPCVQPGHLAPTIKTARSQQKGEPRMQCQARSRSIHRCDRPLLFQLHLLMLGRARFGDPRYRQKRPRESHKRATGLRRASRTWGSRRFQAPARRCQGPKCARACRKRIRASHTQGTDWPLPGRANRNRSGRTAHTQVGAGFGNCRASAPSWFQHDQSAFQAGLLVSAVLDQHQLRLGPGFVAAPRSAGIFLCFRLIPPPL